MSAESQSSETTPGASASLGTGSACWDGGGEGGVREADGWKEEDAEEEEGGKWQRNEWANKAENEKNPIQTNQN